MGKKARGNAGKIMYELLIFESESRDRCVLAWRAPKEHTMNRRWGNEMEGEMFSGRPAGMCWCLHDDAVPAWNENGARHCSDPAGRGDAGAGHRTNGGLAQGKRAREPGIGFPSIFRGCLTGKDLPVGIHCTWERGPSRSHAQTIRCDDKNHFAPRGR